MANSSQPEIGQQAVAGARGRSTLPVWIAIALAVTAGLTSYRVAQRDRWKHGPDRLATRFQLDLGRQIKIAPELIAYQQQQEIKLSLPLVQAIACGPDGRIYVMGDRSLQILNRNGTLDHEIELSDEPSCLAVGGVGHVEPNRIYVGFEAGIRVFEADRKLSANWPLPNQQVRVSSIATADDEVFVADSGNRRVWRFAADGQLLGQIGEPDPARQRPGFVVPNDHFDLVVAPQGLLQIVNPGKLEVATYSFDGDLGATWGAASSTIGGFFGCCNPIYLALLPDGRFATSEQGIPRIKIYSEAGEFVGVVAGPHQLGVPEPAVADPRLLSPQVGFDIAVDRDGRILVLDPYQLAIRVFVALENDITGGATP